MRLKVIHAFVYWWRWLPCKLPTSTSGAVWGSASCPRTLRHADQGNRTSDLPITRRCTSANYNIKMLPSCSYISTINPMYNKITVAEVFLSPAFILSSIFCCLLLLFYNGNTFNATCVLYYTKVLSFTWLLSSLLTSSILCPVPYFTITK